jgi:hypothetical protein
MIHRTRSDLSNATGTSYNHELERVIVQRVYDALGSDLSESQSLLDFDSRGRWNNSWPIPQSVQALISRDEEMHF